MMDLTHLKASVPLAKPGTKKAWSMAALDIFKNAPSCNWWDGSDLIGQAYTSGHTTESVDRTRWELVAPPFYAKNQDRYFTQMTCVLEAVNWYQRVCIMQMHVDDGNDPTAKMIWEKGWIKMLVREWDSSKDPKSVLVCPMDLGEVFTPRLELSKRGELVSLVDGIERTFVIPQARLSRPHVPHWGVYNQVDQGNPQEPLGDLSRIRIKDLGYGPVPIKVDPAEDLARQIKDLVDGYCGGKIDRNQARLDLASISTQIKSLPNKDDRFNLNTQAGEFLKSLK